MSSSPEDNLRNLSLDYLNLLINGQAFSDVTFNVEGRLVHAHRCILAARSHFFRKFFCGLGSSQSGPQLDSWLKNLGPGSPGGSGSKAVIPVNSVGYEVFLLMMQFLYSGRVSIVPQKHEPRPNCGERGCWHTHCTSAVDLALDTLSAARSFGVEQLALLTQLFGICIGTRLYSDSRCLELISGVSADYQGFFYIQSSNPRPLIKEGADSFTKQLAIMVEKASIEDVMRVLIASRKQDMHNLWTTCSHLVAKSGLPPEILTKHLPIDVVVKIEELRLKSNLVGRFLMPHHHHHHDLGSAVELEDQKIRRMRRALDSSDVELVKLMVMGEGLNLDESIALHYAVENCSREVVKALLELGAADVNYPAGPAGKTPLHIAAEMVSPDMVAVLLDHHADPNVRTIDGITSLDILRTLTSDFPFKGVVPGFANIEPNKLRLCLELVQSAAMVISREEGSTNIDPSSTNIYPPNMSDDHTSSTSSGTGNIGSNLNIDSRMVYLNLGAGVTNTSTHDPSSMYHHSHEY